MLFILIEIFSLNCFGQSKLSPFFNQRNVEIEQILASSKNRPFSGKELEIFSRTKSSLLYVFQKSINITDKELEKIDFNENVQFSKYFLGEKSHLKNDLHWLINHLNLLALIDKSILPFYSNQRFRIFFNQNDLSFSFKGHQMFQMIKSIISVRHLEFIALAVRKLKMVSSRLNNQNLPVNLLVNQIFKNEIFQRLEMTISKMNEFRKDFWSYHKRDGSLFLTRNLANLASGIFGNVVGSIRWRKGYLDHNLPLNQEISRELEPLDIITEKSSYGLSDKVIPGYFGHNAIYLGNKEQLEELGIWDKPFFAKYQTDILLGYNIIEVVRKGVRLTRLKEFMNIDQLAILRFKYFVSKRDRIYQNTLLQLNKKYDFNYNVNTTDKLVCSELIYQAFGNIHWPTVHVLGRDTISPDNVTTVAILEGSPLILVKYLKGNWYGKITKHSIEDLKDDLFNSASKLKTYYPNEFEYIISDTLMKFSKLSSKIVFIVPRWMK